MKKIVLIISIFTLAVLQSCQSDDSSASADQNSKVILNTDAATLSNRMDLTQAGVIDLDQSTVEGRSGNLIAFPMALLAELLPPTYNGLGLKATHVDVNGNYVYVTYNSAGDLYLGGIDVIDISNPSNPQLVVQAILPNTDISTVVYDNGQLYFTGSTNIDVANLITPAFVAKMPLQGGLLTNNYGAVSLAGNVGTGIAVADSKYYAITGNNGVLAKINKSTNVVEASVAVADLRALGRIGTKIVVLTGSQGIKVFNADNLAAQSSFATSTDVVDAKRTIDFQGSNVLVAQGYSGLKVYNLSSGSLQQSFNVPTGVPNVDQADVVTNAVSVNGDYVYVANGAAGVSVYKTTNGSLSLQGSIAVGGSSNYVKSVGDYIYVATGTGGLKIIKKVTVASINCTDFPVYTSTQQVLNVNSGQTLNYQGAASLQGINVNANLTFCGSVAVSQGVNINSGGVFTMKGSMAQGQVWSNNPFNINGTMKVEGHLVIYGNLVLNSGAQLQFIGSNSSITVFGTVTKNNGATVSGTFVDVMNKFN